MPLKDEQGRLRGIAAVMRDVTSRFAEIRSLKQKLTEASAPRDTVKTRGRHHAITQRRSIGATRVSWVPLYGISVWALWRGRNPKTWLMSALEIAIPGTIILTSCRNRPRTPYL